MTTSDNLDRLLGSDPVAGLQALEDLASAGDASLHEIAARFGTLPRRRPVLNRLGSLFGRSGETAVDLLLPALKSNRWHAMVDATYCFDQIPERLAADDVASLLGRSPVDVERCAIDALGFLGASGWRFEIENVARKSAYSWEKLAFNALYACMRMGAKAGETGDVRSSLAAVERLGRRDRDLLTGNRSFIQLGMLPLFPPSAGDAFIEEWGSHEDPLYRELTAEALGWMRLARATEFLAERLLDPIPASEQRSYAAALAMIGGSEAATALHTAYRRNLSEELAASVRLALSAVVWELDDASEAAKVAVKLADDADEETRAHACYSCGLLGLGDAPKRALSAGSYIVRAGGALGCARALGPAAVAPLRRAERESSNWMEQVCILAGLSIAGAGDASDPLHRALCDAPATVDPLLLRYLWKRELVLALKRDAAHPERVLAWADVMQLDAGRCAEELSVAEATHGVRLTIPLPDDRTNLGDRPTATHAVGSTDAGVKVFYSYAHEDGRLRDRLEQHLATLRRIGLITEWHDRKISAGSHWEREISRNLDTADLVLLLISPAFMDSEYCYGEEMKVALERDRRGVARVIPIILTGVAGWEDTQLGALQALPTGAVPVRTGHWKNQDEAFNDIARGIQHAAEEIVLKRAGTGVG